MQTFEYLEYGTPDVLHAVDAPMPVPGDDEVLLRVHAASINAMDWRLMLGKPAIARFMAGGLRRPKHTRPGHDVAGTVEAIGRNVTRLKPGDAVFGVCRGALAEFASAREDKLACMPANVSFEQAAAVPVAGSTALQALRDVARVQRGQRVLVDGASGGVGTFAVQVAKALGAKVTAVCSTDNVAAARAMGADRVIDYTREDFSAQDDRYDRILAANAHRSIFAYRRALTADGIFVMAGGGGREMLQGLLLAPLLSLLGRRKLRFVGAKITVADLEALAAMLASGQLRPVIERRYPLRETPDAIRHVAAGHARAKVVVTMAPEIHG